MAEDITDRVKAVTARVLKCDTATMTGATRFAADLGAQSLDSIKLVVAFEEEFGIEMDEDAALQVQTIGSAVDFIQKTIEGQK